MLVVVGYVFQMCKQVLKFCCVCCYVVSIVFEDLSIFDVGKKQVKKDWVLKDKEVGGLWVVILFGDIFLFYYINLFRIIILFGCCIQEVRLLEWVEWDMEVWVWIVLKVYSKGGEKIVCLVLEVMCLFIEMFYDEIKLFGYFFGVVKNSEVVSQWGCSVYKKLRYFEFWILYDLW